MHGIDKYNIILASQSPRRKQILEGMHIPFNVVLPLHSDEEWPQEIKGKEVALYLAEKKMHQMKDYLEGNSMIITADTIVCLNDEVLNKPTDKDDAINMLRKLCGNVHDVFTGVCVATYLKKVSFVGQSKVSMNKLSDEEIEYYIDQCKPFDKAGSYGVQDWIGHVGIQRIEGSFYNVMGLPADMLYENLKSF